MKRLATSSWLIPLSGLVLFAGLLSFGCERKEPGDKDSKAAITTQIAQQPKENSKELRTSPNDDPLSFAERSFNHLSNREATIPPQCYTKTEAQANPCWVCHTEAHGKNRIADYDLQLNYSFSEEAKKNHFSNLFKDRQGDIEKLSDEFIKSYIREDNYEDLRHVLETEERYRGYIPDLSFIKGFSENGFAKDGSGWVAFRYKPFMGAFLPSNGATDDVMIRLPMIFRSKNKQYDLATYQENLNRLEIAIKSNGNKALAHPNAPTHYAGDASHLPIEEGSYPLGTEFLHSVRYLDPDASGMMALRMKELRYSRKITSLDAAQNIAQLGHELEEREEGNIGSSSGHPTSGMRTSIGWLLQGFIEDKNGALRSQSHEESLACVGCHSGIGVTIDGSFSFPRKVPGDKGWAYQSLEGMIDTPQSGQSHGELQLYAERALAADEFRSNTELTDKLLDAPKNKLRQSRHQAFFDQVGHPKKLTELIMPSPQRALQLNKAYLLIVREQSFSQGRDPIISPPQNVYQEIKKESTGLEDSGRYYLDGRLTLDWNRQPEPIHH